MKLLNISQFNFIKFLKNNTVKIGFYVLDKIRILFYNKLIGL